MVQCERITKRPCSWRHSALLTSGYLENQNVCTGEVSLSGTLNINYVPKWAHSCILRLLAGKYRLHKALSTLHASHCTVIAPVVSSICYCRISLLDLPDCHMIRLLKTMTYIKAAGQAALTSTVSVYLSHVCACVRVLMHTSIRVCLRVCACAVCGYWVCGICGARAHI